MGISKYSKAEKKEILSYMYNSRMTNRAWCKRHQISINTVQCWQQEFREENVFFQKIPCRSGVEYYYNQNHRSCFDVKLKTDITQMGDCNLTFMYPGNEEYRWVIFHDIRIGGVIETACNTGMDVWYWNNNRWELFFKFYDDDPFEKNRAVLEAYNIKECNGGWWKHLDEYLIPWSEEDINRICSRYSA